MSKIKLILVILSSFSLPLMLNAQSITAWTEQNGTLGLGYPVPIPVDTPEPFDGFRTYAGLFAKHQSLALESDYITGHIVGQTHYQRDIWAYVLSDANNTTKYGVKEGAMLANGGIHAREWQSPETLTQIITTFYEHSDDQSFYQYLLENTAIITIPVNNVDGFLQTQRYPTENWFANNTGPRDGRMRRKNMLNTDEELSTQNDHLNGVDLNRNNSPYWASTANSQNPRSSNNPESIVYHGPSLESEPETQARINAANLVDAEQLRIYTDVHSFSQVHFSVLTFNNNRNALQTRLLSDFSRHHKAFPKAKNYVDLPSQPGGGIGSTDEYFAYTYEIPSWTLEIEPTMAPGPNQVDRHPELPGEAADYGGFANANGHSGFILPDAEIKRVREQLAESFMVAWYGQAGPPTIMQLRIFDQLSNTIVFDAEWDITTTGERELFSHYYDEIISGRDYSLMIRFDKPMRYRNHSGEVAALPGQSTALNPVIQGLSGETQVALNLSNPRWINQHIGWESYGFYKDDTYVVDFNIDSTINAADDAWMTWKIITTDMIGQSTDANPATVATWANGQWQNYEDSNGEPSINGGFDTTIETLVSNQLHADFARLPETALYYDMTRSGEGYSLEFIDGAGDFLIQWFTYDENGNQQWYVDTDDKIADNAILARDIVTAEGGVFGPGFNNDDIVVNNAGNIEMIFSQPVNDIITGQMKYTYPDGRKFRTQIDQIAAAKGIDSSINIDPPRPPELTAASLIGSWYDPQRNGEGFHLEQLVDDSVVFLWYSYDLDGSKKWFIGGGGQVTETGTLVNIVFGEVYTTTGAQFGDAFDTNDVIQTIWGSAEFNLSCESGSFSYQSNDPEYGQGTYQIIPITRPLNNSYRCE